MNFGCRLSSAAGATEIVSAAAHREPLCVRSPGNWRVKGIGLRWSGCSAIRRLLSGTFNNFEDQRPQIVRNSSDAPA
jgi:hypothetical protein